MDTHSRKESDKAGMSPGTAVYIGEQPPKPTQILTHIYNEKTYQVVEGFDASLINQAIKANDNVWIDVCGLKDANEISDLCLEFNIHPLLIEDMLNTKQRPKLDVLDNYFFIVFKLLGNVQDRPTYSTEQFSLVVKQNFILTIRESSNYSLDGLYQQLNNQYSLIRKYGTDYLTYLMMDNIIDKYFDFVEKAELSLEQMEDTLIHNPEAIQLKSLYTIKRRTLTLRKTIAPLRDIVNLLLSEKNQWINQKHHMYYLDLYDHCIRLLESVDLHREMTTNMLDIYLSTLNNRMNETMKILTLFASIFIPLTFIAGIYGMNFEYMPELKWRYSYPTLLILMVGIVIVMLSYFKRKKLI